MPASGLRVHGGAARGRRLTAPAGIRPSQGLIKEAIFNVLAADVQEARVLDLFAGSGALGIEALSRGAAHVTFVEQGQRGVAAIERNLAAVGYRELATVVRQEAARWLQGNSEEVAAAGIVLLDPPYNDPVLPRTLRLLDRLCGTGTIVVAEHGLRDELPPLERLVAERSRRYGDTDVTVLTC